MLEVPVLIGGEESGGIGYGHHIPERDALLSALYLLEAVAESGQDLGAQYRELQQLTNYHFAYDRSDIHLASMDLRQVVIDRLEQDPLKSISDKAVIKIQTTDGYKFHLADKSWLLIRFSGTEPVLRLYCEAPTLELVSQNLNVAKEWVESIVSKSR
jgi:phosphomannomutase